MAEWISVEDRLPDENNIYLIYTNYANIALAYYKDDWKIQPYTFVISLNTWQRPRGYVTHWIPLPEPPIIKIIINIETGEQKEVTVDELTAIFEEAIRRACL